MSYLERGQEKRLTLDELAEIQKEFMASPAWDASRDPQEQFRHIVLHIGKLMGKVSEVAERREHDQNPSTQIVREQVVADLLFYAQQIAELEGVDLQEVYLQRLDENAARVAVWVEKRDGPKV